MRIHCHQNSKKDKVRETTGAHLRLAEESTGKAHQLTLANAQVFATIGNTHLKLLRACVDDIEQLGLLKDLRRQNMITRIPKRLSQKGTEKTNKGASPLDTFRKEKKRFPTGGREANRGNPSQSDSGFISSPPTDVRLGSG